MKMRLSFLAIDRSNIQAKVVEMMDLQFERNNYLQDLARRDFSRTDKGLIKSDSVNYCVAMLNPAYCWQDGILPGTIFLDEYSRQIMYQGVLRGEKGDAKQLRVWTDAMTNKVGMEIAMTYNFAYSKGKMDDAVIFMAEHRKKNLAISFLEQLEADDDKDYIRMLLPKYLGAEDTELNRWIMEHMLLNIIRRIYHPGCKADEMMVLVSGQGLGKSTFCKRLAVDPSWYCSLSSIEGKDAVTNILGKTIVEIDEFVALKRVRVVNEAKRYISEATARVRLPYSRRSEDVPRTCVFIATVNDRDFLNDHSGERRFLPVDCNEIRRTHRIYYEASASECKGFTRAEYESIVQSDFDRALAQARELYRSGKYDVIMPDTLIKAYDREIERFKYVHPDVEDIRTFLMEYKERSDTPNITCFRELTTNGYPHIKSGSFTAIMEYHFKDWEPVLLNTAMRLRLDGVSFVVKKYYRKKCTGNDPTVAVEPDSLN